MKERWMEHAKKADFEAWGKALDVSPLTARVIRNRGILSIEEAREYLYGTPEELKSPEHFREFRHAADLLEKADREKRENRAFVIRIVLIVVGSLVLLSVSFVVSFLQWIPAIIGLLAIIMIFAVGEYRGIGCLVFILFGILISILEALGFKVL